MKVNTHFSARHRTRRFSLALKSVSLALGLMLWASPVRVSANSAQTTHRVYLYTSSGFVDVTNNTFYQGAQVFIAYGGGVFEVVLDHEEGHVYDLATSQIGFMLEEPDA